MSELEHLTELLARARPVPSHTFVARLRTRVLKSAAARVRTRIVAFACAGSFFLLVALITAAGVGPLSH